MWRVFVTSPNLLYMASFAGLSDMYSTLDSLLGTLYDNDGRARWRWNSNRVKVGYTLSPHVVQVLHHIAKNFHGGTLFWVFS